MTKEEKMNVVRGLSGEKLMQLFMAYYSDIDNIFYDMYESFEVVRDEIIRRCNQ